MLSVTEANAVNVVLQWLLGVSTPGDPVGPSSEQVHAAARILAESANERLMAGLDGDDVDRIWPTRPLTPSLVMNVNPGLQPAKPINGKPRKPGVVNR